MPFKTPLPVLLTLISLNLLLLGCSEEKKPVVNFQEDTPEQTQALTREVFSQAGPDRLAGVSEEELSELNSYFKHMGELSRSDEKMDIYELISSEAILSSLESAGYLDGLNDMQRQGFKLGMAKGLQRFDQSIKMMAFDDHRIMRVDTIDGNQRIVYVRHYDNDLGVTSQRRWWLFRTDDGWRFYDFEELSAGLRMMTLMGLVLKNGLGQESDPWVPDVVRVSTLLYTVDMTDPASIVKLKRPLLKLRKNQLPPDIQRFASMLYASCLQCEGDFDGSIEELKAAKAGGYDSPMHFYQMGLNLYALENYEEALAAFKKHGEVLGRDSDALEMESDCLLELGRLDEARAVALEGLADNPNALGCLASLVVASTPEQIKESATVDLFAHSNEPAYAYEAALDYAIEMGYLPQARALFEIFKKGYPDNEYIFYYEQTLAQPE